MRIASMSTSTQNRSESLVRPKRLLSLSRPRSVPCVAMVLGLNILTTRLNLGCEASPVWDFWCQGPCSHKASYSGQRREGQRERAPTV